MSSMIAHTKIRPMNKAQVGLIAFTSTAIIGTSAFVLFSRDQVVVNGLAAGEYIDLAARDEL